jgi:hypothetical protein
MLMAFGQSGVSVTYKYRPEKLELISYVASLVVIMPWH